MSQQSLRPQPHPSAPTMPTEEASGDSRLKGLLLGVYLFFLFGFSVPVGPTPQETGKASGWKGRSWQVGGATTSSQSG
jgi:hypothetical protein